MPQLPSGTVTFLFTDIEGSTQLLKQIGPHYAEVLAEHQRIVREAAAAHGGHEVDTQGDSFFIAFPRGKDALAAAVAAQRDLHTHAWPEGVEVKVRMGLHTGEPKVGEQRYVGMGVHKAARIGAAGHGGQVLLSATTRELVEDELPSGVTIRDLGERRLKDVERPERLSQLVIEGLPSEFDALKTIDVELARRRRRMYVGSALIGVLAAAVAIPVFALGQGGGGGGTVVEPNFVALVDPQSNSVVDTVQVGARPRGVAVGEGSVWVANQDDKTLSRIDAATHDLVRTITLDATPTGVAVGLGSVWVANGLVGTVVRVDTTTNEPVEPIEVTFRSNAGTVAVGEGAIWAAFGNGEVGRIAPRRPRSRWASRGALRRHHDRRGWSQSANAFDHSVSRMNPRTVSVVAPITVGRRPSGVALGDGSLSVSTRPTTACTGSTRRRARRSRPSPWRRATAIATDRVLGFGTAQTERSHASTRARPRRQHPGRGQPAERIAVGADGISVTFQAPLD